MDIEQKRVYAKNALIDCESDVIFQLFTDYHGMELLSDGFIDFLVNNNICEPVLLEGDYLK